MHGGVTGKASDGLPMSMTSGLIVQRQPCFFPGVEASEEWVNVFPAVVHQQLCHTGTGCFVRSSAVSDDRPVTRDLIE